MIGLERHIVHVANHQPEWITLAAVAYLHSIGLETIQVDAFTDSAPAVAFYTNFGFQVIRTFLRRS